MKYIITGRLAGLNKYTLANRSNRYGGSALKKEMQGVVSGFVRAQGVFKAPKPCVLSFRWFEQNKRRDLDNVAFAKKFILDSFVEMGVLENDGWADVVGFTDMFYVDKENPRIEITITEI